MKIFNKTELWPHKVNFVDERNVVLGYDLMQGCCESAGWFISDTITADIPTDWSENKLEFPPQFPLGAVTDLAGWNFDPGFMATIKNEVDLDQGKILIFRITNGSKAEKFVHIFNAHSGYYSHNFTFSGHGDVALNDSI